VVIGRVCQFRHERVTKRVAHNGGAFSFRGSNGKSGTRVFYPLDPPPNWHL